MKPKLLFVLLFSLFTIYSGAQVIFDPATYPKDSLPEGMTIDTIDGKAYVQIILNEWSSYIKINPTVNIDKKATHFRTVAKLGAGVSGFELSKIKTFLKLTGPDYTELAAGTNNSSDTLVRYQVALTKNDPVGFIQVAGQETTNWTAVTGDTLWLGKIMAVEVDPQAIFDPAAFDPADLPAGMSIVEVDSVKYCQVILNGENSYFDIPAFTVSSSYNNIRTKTKYAGGVSGFSLAKIGIGIYLYDADHMALVEASLNTLPKTDFTLYKDPLKTGVATRLRVYAVGKPAFTPIVGDTMWIGKVRAINSEKGVIFDPAQCDPDELPSGMSIVSSGDTKYMQVILNEWNSAIPVDPINAPVSYSHFSTNARYAVGTSGFPLNKINTFFKVATANWTELGAAGSASSTEFKKYSVPLDTTGIIANFQFAGQETTNWTAVKGDTLWIGKTYLEDKLSPSVPVNLAASVDTTSVTLTWDASTDNQGIKGYEISQDDEVLDTVTAKTFVVTDLAPGTYTFKVVAFDASGNRSAFASAEVTISTTSIRTQHAEKLIIYPNPVTSTLQVSKVQGVLEIKIINLTGSTVRTVHNTNRVDVSDLREGLYLIRVKTGSGIFSTTFVKE